jgi:hypothetical protein
MRAAPPDYNQQDQQDVRNAVETLSRAPNKPVERILVQDITTRELYYIQVNSGVLEAVAV